MTYHKMILISESYKCITFSKFNLKERKKWIPLPQTWKPFRGKGQKETEASLTAELGRQLELNVDEEQNCLSMKISSLTQTLVHFLSLASLYFVGPTQTATLKCSVQPSRG